MHASSDKPMLTERIRHMAANTATWIFFIALTIGT
jgi:hypothetical protein